MKLGSLLILAFLAPALFCQAQDKAPADQPAAQDAAKPAAPGQGKPDAGPPAATAGKGSDVIALFGRLGHSGSKAAAQATAKPARPEATAPTPQDAVTPPAPDTTAPPAPATAAPAVADTYVIGASDVLAVTVFKEPALSGNLLVRPDGMISIPLLGDVKASGKTPAQLAEEVTAKLKKFIQDPNVTVVLNQINSKKIYLIGEIGRTGPLEMTPGMTLLEAIASAGGITEFANSKKMYILRTEDGKQQKIPVQYKQALKGDASFNITLKSGDTLVVP